MSNLIIAIQVNLILAIVGRIFRAADNAGLIAGGLLGVFIFTLGRLPAYVPFTTFVVIAAAIRYGVAAYRRYSGLPALDHGDIRSITKMLANCFVPAIFVLFAPAPSAYIALTAGFAAALAHTASSEIGELMNTQPVDLLTMRPAAPGDDGAISFEGTIDGLVAAALLALAACAAGAVMFAHIWIVLLAAGIGNLFNSIACAIIPRRMPWANEVANLAATSTACVVALVLGRMAM